MYSLLVCFIVVVSLKQSWQIHRQDYLIDVTDECSKGRNITLYLTTALGISDAVAVVIARQKNVKCTIHFIVKEERYIIMVVEFIDWLPKKYHCGNRKNVVTALLKNNKAIDVCGYVEAADTTIFRIVERNKISLAVAAEKNFETLKVVATSIRESSDGKCKEATETKCVFLNVTFCMEREFECDGYANCGVHIEYDEDKNLCERSSPLTPAMVVVGLVIVFVTFCLLVAVLKHLIPNRKGTFIFKEDETLSERDRATSQKQFYVNLRILYDSLDGSNRMSLEEPLLPNARRMISFRKIKHSRP